MAYRNKRRRTFRRGSAGRTRRSYGRGRRRTGTMRKPRPGKIGYRL